MPAAAPGRRVRRGHGVFHFRGLVAEDQQPPAARWLEIFVQGHRLGDAGDAQDAALFGRLDDIGAHPLEY
jgi:hypothetical protein